MLKKFSLLFGLLLLFASFAGCGSTTPSETPGGDDGGPKFDPTDLPYYVEDTDTLTYSYSEEERLRPFGMGIGIT